MLGEPGRAVPVATFYVKHDIIFHNFQYKTFDLWKIGYQLLLRKALNDLRNLKIKKFPFAQKYDAVKVSTAVMPLLSTPIPTINNPLSSLTKCCLWGRWAEVPQSKNSNSVSLLIFLFVQIAACWLQLGILNRSDRSHAQLLSVTVTWWYEQ